MPVQKASTVSYGSDIRCRAAFTYRSSGTTVEGTATLYLYNAYGALIYQAAMVSEGSGVYGIVIPGTYLANPGRYRIKAIFTSSAGEQLTEEYDILAVRGIEA